MDHRPLPLLHHRPPVLTLKSPLLPIAAIVGIVILEVVAMLTGHNGTLLRIALVLIAGLGGFALDRIVRKTK